VQRLLFPVKERITFGATAIHLFVLIRRATVCLMLLGPKGGGHRQIYLHVTLYNLETHVRTPPDVVRKNAFVEHFLRLPRQM
jgi:hypothetical protein